MSPSSTHCRSASIRRKNSKSPARCSKAHVDSNAADRRNETVMTKHKIAFQGEPGANSHLAIHQAYPDAEAVACPTFEDAFTAITERDADLGMIPIKQPRTGRATA